MLNNLTHLLLVDIAMRMVNKHTHLVLVDIHPKMLINLTDLALVDIPTHLHISTRTDGEVVQHPQWNIYKNKMGKVDAHS